jgi:endoglucanase
MRKLAFVLAVAGCGSSSAKPDAPATGDGPRGDTGTAALRLRGTNLSGAEFGTALPGQFGVDYIYPDPTYEPGYTSQDYFVGKGMNAFRLPFMWERLQRQLGAAFDATELTRLDTTVNHLTAKGAYVILDPHNFARYNDQVVGSPQVPASAFADLWSRLAAHYKGNDHVIFGLVNEPHDMPTEVWRDDANAAIAAIRGAGAHNLVTVPGNAYTGAWSWTKTNLYGTPNGVALLDIVDPDDNFVYEVHQYLDSDYSGSHTACQSGTIGVDSLVDLTAWLHAHGKRAFLGEVGADANAQCMQAVDGLLSQLDANSDIYIGWNWWSAGPWWDAYFMTLEPMNGNDAPQLATLAKHIP